MLTGGERCRGQSLDQIISFLSTGLCVITRRNVLEYGMLTCTLLRMVATSLATSCWAIEALERCLLRLTFHFWWSVLVPWCEAASAMWRRKDCLAGAKKSHWWTPWSWNSEIQLWGGCKIYVGLGRHSYPSSTMFVVLVVLLFLSNVWHFYRHLASSVTQKISKLLWQPMPRR